MKTMIRPLVWLILTAPLAVVTYFYLSGSWFYGEYLHATGDWSAKLLIIALALTPMRRLLPRSRLLGWLLGQRRYIGLAACGYALAHLLAYLVRAESLETVLNEAWQPGMLSGWVALIILVPLTLTSNDLSVAWLGRRWKYLHRFVYIAALLTFAHWVLLAFDPVAAYAHAAVLVVIECFRLVERRLQSREGAEE